MRRPRSVPAFVHQACGAGRCGGRAPGVRPSRLATGRPRGLARRRRRAGPGGLTTLIRSFRQGPDPTRHTSAAAGAGRAAGRGAGVPRHTALGCLVWPGGVRQLDQQAGAGSAEPAQGGLAPNPAGSGAAAASAAGAAAQRCGGARQRGEVRQQATQSRERLAGGGWPAQQVHSKRAAQARKTNRGCTGGGGALLTLTQRCASAKGGAPGWRRRGGAVRRALRYRPPPPAPCLGGRARDSTYL